MGGYLLVHQELVELSQETTGDGTIPSSPELIVVISHLLAVHDFVWNVVGVAIVIIGTNASTTATASTDGMAVKPKQTAEVATARCGRSGDQRRQDAEQRPQGEQDHQRLQNPWRRIRRSESAQ